MYDKIFDKIYNKTRDKQFSFSNSVKHIVKIHWDTLYITW